MWNDLPTSQKDEYKRLILAFASLTGMFAQKSTDDDIDVAPIINSKFQETAFQRAFGAYAEDIGNTSYDVSVEHNGEKYLVGIKTFGIASGDQKVAQFKAKHDEWSKIIDEIKNNARKKYILFENCGIKFVFPWEKQYPNRLKELYDNLDSLDELCALIRSSIQEEPPLAMKEGGIIKEGYNEMVDQLRNAKTEGKTWLANLEASEKEKTGIKNLKIKKQARLMII